MHREVGDIVKEYECYQGRDEEFDSLVLDEDKLVQVMRPFLSQGGNLIDFHCCEIFPIEDIDLVIVVTAENSILYDRLTNR